MRTLLWLLSALFFLPPLPQAEARSPVRSFAKPAIAAARPRIRRTERIRKQITAAFLTLPAAKQLSLWEVLWKADSKESCDKAKQEWRETKKALGVAFKLLMTAAGPVVPRGLKGWGCQGRKILLWDIALAQKKLSKERLSLLLEYWKKKLKPPLPSPSNDDSHAHMLEVLLKHQKQIPNHFRWMWDIAANQQLRGRRNQLVKVWNKMPKRELAAFLNSFSRLPQSQQTKVEKFFLNVPGRSFVNFLEEGFRKLPGDMLLQGLGMRRLTKEFSFVELLQKVMWREAKAHRKQILRLTIKLWHRMKNSYIRRRLAKILELPGAWGLCLQLLMDDAVYRTLVPRFIMGAHPGLGMGLLSLLFLGGLMGGLVLFRRWSTPSGAVRRA